MYFIGIDLAWKVKRLGTAVAVLSERKKLVDLKNFTFDNEIINYIKKYVSRGVLIGIDAPLACPKNVKSRYCDRVLQKCKIPILPVNRKIFFQKYGGFRGQRLVKKLQLLGVEFVDILPEMEKKSAVLEVYPTASLKILFNYSIPTYKNAPLKEIKKGLRKILKKYFQIGIKIDEKKFFHCRKLDRRTAHLLADGIDAVISAYTVYMYWKFSNKNCILIGDKKDGYILTLADEKLKTRISTGISLQSAK